MERLTEQPSKYKDLEKKSVEELIRDINREDQLVALAIQKVLPDIAALITAVEKQLKNGGRMFYLGCGSGGRLSVLDAIELPNTYGIEKGIVNVVLAGGVEHLVEALEEKEDDVEEGWETLQEAKISSADIVVGISASGTTPYVLETLKKCREHSIPCGSIVGNPDSPISTYSDYPVMVRLGRVKGNRMVNARLTNNKLVDRSTKTLMVEMGLTDYEEAKSLILKCGNVQKAMDFIRSGKNV